MVLDMEKSEEIKKLWEETAKNVQILPNKEVDVLKLFEIIANNMAAQGKAINITYTNDVLTLSIME